MEREQLVLEIAHDVGFDLAGIAPVAPPRAARRFEEWLAAEHHGDLTYLERFRERILDPRLILPDAKSMIVVGLAHSRAGVELAGGGRIARYAAGRDYHNVMGRMLRKLARRLEATGLLGRKRSIVDAGPLLERSHAAEAGLGFESKAANLLHPRFGPWFFLGELLVEWELEPTTAPPAGSCGTCTACIDACPTKAILEPGVVDAPRCISYQTIENRGAIPDALRPDVGTWAFGCDVCSEVCPWGGKAPDLTARFGTHRALAGAGLVQWLDAGEELSALLEGSPLRRPGRAGLARNAAIALGSIAGDESRRALLRALSFDPAELVRESAAWALGRVHAGDQDTRAGLERALEREGDPIVQASIQRSREHCG